MVATLAALVGSTATPAGTAGFQGLAALYGRGQLGGPTSPPAAGSVAGPGGGGVVCTGTGAAPDGSVAAPGAAGAPPAAAGAAPASAGAATVKRRLAGVASAMPERVTAATRNVWRCG